MTAEWRQLRSAHRLFKRPFVLLAVVEEEGKDGTIRRIRRTIERETVDELGKKGGEKASKRKPSGVEEFQRRKYKREKSISKIIRIIIIIKKGKEIEGRREKRIGWFFIFFSKTSCQGSSLLTLTRKASRSIIEEGATTAASFFAETPAGKWVPDIR